MMRKTSTRISVVMLAAALAGAAPHADIAEAQVPPPPLSGPPTP